MHRTEKRVTRCMPVAVLALAVCAAPAAWAVDPGPNEPSHVAIPPGPATPTGGPGCTLGDTIFCDQMAMVGAGTYDAGNGNAMAGQAVFGTIFDLQVADDCVVPDPGFILTGVCQASVTFLGATPATAMWVQVYADNGGFPAETSSFDEVVSPGSYSVTTFPDPIFGLVGTVICADVTDITLPAGNWYFSIQPIDTTAGGDWYFQVRDFASLNGSDSYGKDGGEEHGSAFGGPYGGGYGVSDWTSMASLGFGAGDAAFCVGGVQVPVELQSFDVE